MLTEKIQKVLIIGCGGVGSLLSTMLSELGMSVSVLDRQLNYVLLDGVNFIQADVRQEEKLENIMKDYDAVVSCLPHYLTITVANLAHKLNLHYFDPTEDVEDTNAIRLLASTSEKLMIPQCGLAPGLVGIIGAQLIKFFDKNTIEKLSLRVGALPLNPIGKLGYACNWSPEGLVNEYLEEATAIVGSEIKTILGGDSNEVIRINGIEYEAFSTAGGLGTMTETYINEIYNLDYKTIRYPGHRTGMFEILRELKYNKKNNNNKSDIVTYMRQNYPPDADDRVLIHVSSTGKIDGKLQTKTFVADYRPEVIAGEKKEAIFWTTACSIASVVSLVSSGILPDKGFVKQEDIPLSYFLMTKHGKLFSKNCLEITDLVKYEMTDIIIKGT